MMKKNRLYLILVVFTLVFCFNSCLELPDKDDTSNDSRYTEDIVGRWRKASESDENPVGNYLYYVYQSDGWGYTWDEGDDFSEQETLNNYHGNGWFEWSIYGGRLTEIHHFKSSSSVSTKTYKIRQLTSNRLVKYDEAGSKEQVLTKN